MVEAAPLLFPVCPGGGGVCPRARLDRRKERALTSRCPPPCCTQTEVAEEVVQSAWTFGFFPEMVVCHWVGEEGVLSGRAAELKNDCCGASCSSGEGVGYAGLLLRPA